MPTFFVQAGIANIFKYIAYIQSVLIQSVYIIFYFILFRILVIIYAFNNLFLHCILYRHTYIIYIYIQYISCIQ